MTDRAVPRHGAEPSVELSAVTKRYGAVSALTDVDFSAEDGEVHAIVGLNGAGKSTLVKILAGAVQPDSGRVLIRGKHVQLRNPADSVRAGIAVVHQELSLLPDLEVAYNVCAGDLPKTAWRTVDGGRLYRETTAVLKRLGVELEPRAQVGQLSLSNRQLVEIARALRTGGNILLLDEPNSALTLDETDTLLAIVRSLADMGKTVILVSHRLGEVLTTANRITVLRDGRSNGTWLADERNRDEIVSAMTGPLVNENAATLANGLGPAEALGKAGLRLTGATSGTVGPIDLVLNPGEVVALVGLEGSGVDEVLRMAGGVIPMRGTLEVSGQVRRFGSPGDAIAAGVVYMPPDRKVEGLWLEFSFEDNVVAGDIKRVTRAGLLSRQKAVESARMWANRLGITGLLSTRTQVGSLSGGNQQKALLARCLVGEPGVLLLSDPTRGVDIVAKGDIHRILRQIAANGIAVCIASSEFSESLVVADTIVCMRRGKVAAQGPSSAFDEAKLVELVGSATAA